MHLTESHMHLIGSHLTVHLTESHMYAFNRITHVCI